MWECSTIARSPALSSDMTDGQEVQGPVEVLLLQAEIRGRDGGGEAAVEGLGQAQRLVGVVPAQLDRQLVGAQLADVEEAKQLDPGEVGLAEPAELVRAVLVHVPRIVRLLRTGWRQGEQVGG